ncbi:hypothetical protein AB431_00875 [Mycobacterium sp. EPa45]|nr:hypothetical protein AB431_00875 [Mycobacterium sp. EPa45]
MLFDRRYTAALPPAPGALAIPREWYGSPGALVGAKVNWRNRVRSVTFISMLANAAPMQRRIPPPNGIHE